ncbi:DUF342 domain-containing protein [Thalassobacillus hwangdonensis]|uniref:DUF342 domain-containing protein n=1 Tax=Thalassobacillus hwangdonensis TaxID=546108 RepID=A0ABW3KWF0_9BACI
MDGFDDHFSIAIHHDKLQAELHIEEEYKDQLHFSPDELIHLLNERNIIHGINETAIQSIADGLDRNHSPVIIASGDEPQAGEDGKIIFDKQEAAMTIEHDERVNFRDILQLPTASEGERIARLTPPTLGVPGRNIFGKELPAKPGKSARIRAGKNVRWKESGAAFYAEATGQLSFNETTIHVYPLYEVQGDLDMRTGNLDFVGSIRIRGNVPTGYRISAKGDITIMGLVEGAEIEAGGSVHIHEGISGQKRAVVRAGMDVRAGYINQCYVEAGRNILAENSILHSECIAKEHIYCQQGNIIGGSSSAGITIEAKDVGNRMHSPTGLYIGINKKVHEKEKVMKEKSEQINETIQKLRRIGSLLDSKGKAEGKLAMKDRITLLRQKNSLDKCEKELEDIEFELERTKSTIGTLDHAKLTVKGTMYSGVDLGFGKYQRKILQTFKTVNVTLDDGEVCITPMV